MLDSLATFWDRCSDWGITFVSLPTAFWHELSRDAEALVKHVPSSVRTLVIGGEKAQADRLKLWRKHNGTRIRLLNTYGPTESTVVASCCDITEGDFEEVPIGRPIPNVKLYVLDDLMQPVPRGVNGEIYIDCNVRMSNLAPKC